MFLHFFQPLSWFPNEFPRNWRPGSLKQTNQNFDKFKVLQLYFKVSLIKVCVYCIIITNNHNYT